MNYLSRLAAVMGKELLQLRRDRLTFAMIVGIPVMQMLLFGYAINTDVRNLGAAYADMSNTHSPASSSQIFHSRRLSISDFPSTARRRSST